MLRILICFHCQELEKQFCVDGDQILEICIAQNWSSSGRTLLDLVDITFGGLKLAPSKHHAASNLL